MEKRERRKELDNRWSLRRRQVQSVKYHCAAVNLWGEP